MKVQGSEIRDQRSGFPDKSGFPLRSNRCQGSRFRACPPAGSGEVKFKTERSKAKGDQKTNHKEDRYAGGTDFSLFGK